MTETIAKLRKEVLEEQFKTRKCEETIKQMGIDMVNDSDCSSCCLLQLLFGMHRCHDTRRHFESRVWCERAHLGVKFAYGPSAANTKRFP